MKILKFIFIVELLALFITAGTHFFYFVFDVEFNVNLYLLIPALVFFYLLIIKFILIPLSRFIE